MTSSSVEFGLTDESTHRYYFTGGKIYYIVINSSDVEEKYIELCRDIKSCSFSYNSGVLTTQITIGDITYNNTFNI